MVEPWFREVGFIICYGAIVLKLYRHLVEFRTRKAHRYVVRDLDLLRYLCAMIVAVLCYLAAFTALCIDYLEHSELIWNVEMESITTSNMCKPLKWDYVSETDWDFALSFRAAAKSPNSTWLKLILHVNKSFQVTQAGEMLILAFGIQLAYASRNAITQFRVSWIWKRDYSWMMSSNVSDEKWKQRIFNWNVVKQSFKRRNPKKEKLFGSF